MDGNGLYTIKNNGYNQDVLPGNSISIGVTLSSNAEEVTFNPEWYLLNTKEIVIDDALYSLEYSEYSAWDNGFTGVINLQTYIDCQHWQIAFDCNRQILSMSSVEFVDEGESRYSITHDSNNLSLMVGNNNGFGVQGVNSEEELILSNMIFTSVVPAYSVTDDSNSDGIPDCLDFINANIGTISTPTVTTTPIEEVTVVPTRNPETTESEQSTITPPIVVTDVPNTPSQNIDWNVDTDQDGLPDDYEDLIGTEKDNPDSDDDGLTDYFEIMLGYNPTNKDSDNNGIFDGDEDYDNDGLTNVQEVALGTNLTLKDSDADGLFDIDEITIHGTDPNNYDTDNDGVCDGEEIVIGKNPIDATDGSIKVLQTINTTINNIESPEITAVDITMSVEGVLERCVYVEDLYEKDMYSTDVYGRIGSPLGLHSNKEFDTAIVTIYYNESLLNNVEESNLGVLWFDEESGLYIVQNQAIVDEVNNTITIELTHFSTYVLVDLAKWNNLDFPDYSDYIFVVHEEMNDYGCNAYVPSQEYLDNEAWWWWHLTRENIKKLSTLNFEAVNTRSFWYDFHFDWLVMDATDNDMDGIPDFLEVNGVMGSNGKIYYSDPTLQDTDEDGIIDGAEFGRYILFNNTLIFTLTSNPAIKDSDYDGEDDLTDPGKWVNAPSRDEDDEEPNGTNWLQSDSAGRYILLRYLIGRGEEFSISNQFWTDYMESNDLLLDQVRNIVFQQAEGIRIGEERNIDITCHMEIDNGESISGYQYLHGTNASVGDFHIYGTITCLENGDIKYNLTYVWNDIIDPNPDYGTDILKNLVAERFFRQTMGAYIIRISWSDVSIIGNNSSGWLANE